MRIEELLIRVKDDSRDTIYCDGDVYSYKSLYEQAQVLSQEIQKGNYSQNVLLTFENSFEYLVSYFAVLLSGRTVVPIRYTSTLEEILNVIEFCEINLVLSNSKKVNELCNELWLYQNSISIYVADKKKFLNSQIHKKNQFNIEEKDIALLIQTSGTSGNPKLVMLSHENVLENIRSVQDSFQFTSDDKTLIVLPLCLSSANIHFLLHVYLDAKLVITRRPFYHTNFFNMLEKENVTNCICVPWIFKCFVEKSHNRRFRDLKCLGSSAGVMEGQLYRKALEMYPNMVFFNCYGQTEASPRISHNRIDLCHKKYDAIGKPLRKVSVKIVNEEGEELEANQKGEIVVKGPNVMLGYYKNPVATEACIKGGWLHTGDIGYKDLDGDIYLSGRLKNVIISNGNNIFPEEVEQVILQCPGVIDVMVYGKKHVQYQEIPVAKVVIDSNIVSLQELSQYCIKHIQRYKCPKEFEQCSSIEKTISGKIIRRM